MKLLADTTFLIDLMVGDEAALKKAKEIEAKSTPLTVSSPTVFELHVSLSLSSKAEEEENAKIMAVLKSLPFLSLDYESSKAGGIIYGDKKRAGKTMDPEDAMIAGIAKVNSKKILTRNIKHFQGIEGVSVEPY